MIQKAKGVYVALEAWRWSRRSILESERKLLFDRMILYS